MFPKNKFLLNLINLAFMKPDTSFVHIIIKIIAKKTNAITTTNIKRKVEKLAKKLVVLI